MELLSKWKCACIHAHWATLCPSKLSCKRDITAHALRSLVHIFCFVSLDRPQQHKTPHRKEEHHQVERFLKTPCCWLNGSKTQTHRHAAPYGAGGAEPPDQFDQCMKAKSLGLAHHVTRQIVFDSVWTSKNTRLHLNSGAIVDKVAVQQLAAKHTTVGTDIN